MKQALLIIDVQNDYFEGGAMTLADPDQALSQINRLETYFVEQNLPVIYIQHINPPEATFFVPIHLESSYMPGSSAKLMPLSFQKTNRTVF